MNRRTVLGAGVAACLLPLAPAFAQTAPASGVLPPDHPLQPAWLAWKAAYLLPDGRIVDGPQQKASHSEGQGYGASLALAFGDRTAFQSIVEWSEANLAVRQDALLAWRWLPDKAIAVADRNNATDGDLFYAWALARAASTFGVEAYAERAREIAVAVATRCVVPHPDGSARLVLSPGVTGFASAEGQIINPSYYMPRAMRELAALTGQDRLRQCADDGVAWINDIATNTLVPDWVLLTATGDLPAPDLSPHSGYDAMRVSLFLLWSGLTASPALRRFSAAHERGYEAGQGVPTVFDAATGTVRERSADVGFEAIPALAACALSGRPGAAIPPFTADQPYYPATLHLMTLIAQAEGYSACVPI